MVTGAIATALGVVIENLGSLFLAAYSIGGALGGPTTGVFLCAFLCPWASARVSTRAG